MEGLEGKEGEEELGEATDVTDREEPPSAESESLTAKLREILYDPRSYSLGDLTEESVYKDYQVWTTFLGPRVLKKCNCGRNTSLTFLIH